MVRFFCLYLFINIYALHIFIYKSIKIYLNTFSILTYFKKFKKG